MCPYCGEEVPDDSPRCWKCGTEIAEGAAAAASEDDEELDVPDDEDAPEGDDPASRRVELASCPFCDSLVPKNALRCRECGRTIRSPESARGVVAWRVGPWVAFLAVAGGAALLVALVTTSRVHARWKETLENLRYDQLLAKIDPSRDVGERHQRIWEEHFQGKFVKWEHYVWSDAPREGRGGWEVELGVEATHEKGARPAVILVFESERQAKDFFLKRGEKTRYTARLRDLDGGQHVFVLDRPTRESN